MLKIFAIVTVLVAKAPLWLLSSGADPENPERGGRRNCDERASLPPKKGKWYKSRDQRQTETYAKICHKIVKFWKENLFSVVIITFYVLIAFSNTFRRRKYYLSRKITRVFLRARWIWDDG